MMRPRDNPLDQLPARPIRVRRGFIWSGPIPRSKSWLNRAVILRTIVPGLEIQGWEPGDQDGDDVRLLTAACERLQRREYDEAFDIGHSGTGLRFLLARLSCESGSFRIRGSDRLFSRPHQTLFLALRTLGCECDSVSTNEVQIQSQGWRVPTEPVEIDGSESSQFLSALLLASVHTVAFKPAPRFRLKGALVSRGYLEMTVQLIERCGFKVEKSDDGLEYQVVKGERLQKDLLRLEAEPDWSAAFTLACLAGVQDGGELILSVLDTENFNSTAQPDILGFELLKQSGVQIEVIDGRLTVRGQSQRTGITADLSGAPDLFPCLASLLATAASESHLYGASHLALKESDRIAGIAKLFRLLEIDHTPLRDGMRIRPMRSESREMWSRRAAMKFALEYSPDRDHRLAFATAVLAQSGAPIQCMERGVVDKSHRGFWDLVEGSAPRLAVVGHRGSGKSHFSAKLARKLKARHFDLDALIDANRVLKEKGESELRTLELTEFMGLEHETRFELEPVVFSMGGGFDPGQIPPDIEVIWIRRKTDRNDRVFLDRPRLNSELTAREEWRSRFEMREPRFKMRADRIIEVAEGASEIQDPFEEAWIEDLAGGVGISNLGGVVSLSTESNLVPTIERALRWGVGALEVRDDLIRSREAWDALRFVPADRLLVSYRNPKQQAATREFIEDIGSETDARPLVDWPYFRRSESKPSEGLRTILSVHDVDVPKGHTWLDVLKTPETEANVLKVAVTVSSFEQLIAGHRWMMEHPKARVFLPMTPSDGSACRWSWYRSLMGVRSPLGFWREDDGTSADQPSVRDWYHAIRRGESGFAAVLGDPVAHSRTPLEQREFFARHGLPVFAISIRRDEWGEALSFLAELGLKAAAVTSPLKDLAARACEMSEPVNTIWIKDDKWKGTSTDAEGFAALIQEAGIDSSDRVLVFGGGGVLPSIQSVLKNAVYVSKRHPLSEAGQTLNSESADWTAIVWAAGDDRGDWDLLKNKIAFAPSRSAAPGSKPLAVIDLSYTEASAGRDIAIELGAKYVSGLKMFLIQAQAQRRVWSNEIDSRQRSLS